MQSADFGKPKLYCHCSQTHYVVRFVASSHVENAAKLHRAQTVLVFNFINGMDSVKSMGLTERIMKALSWLMYASHSNFQNDVSFY